MKISASYTELTELVSSKTQKKIEFEYGGYRDAVIVRFSGIPFFVRILHCDSESLTLAHHIGSSPEIVGDGSIDLRSSQPQGFFNFLKRGAQAFSSATVSAAIDKFVKHPAVTVNDDKSVTISFGMIPQLAAVLEKVNLYGISFDSGMATVEMSLR